MAEYKIPKKVKYRKQQRGRRAGAAKRGTTIAFGQYALKAMEAAWITGQQIEAGVLLSHASSSAAANSDPHLPRQADHQEARGNAYGQRQGRTRRLGCRRQAGPIIFEMEGVDKATAQEAMRLAAAKLPIKTKFVSRQDEGGGVL